MRKIIFSALSFLIAHVVLAQSGKIAGKVIDAGSGQGLANATVILTGTSSIQIADQNGNFSFSKLAPGIYSVKCSYSANEKTVDSILVKNNDVTSITISLEQRAMGGVVIRTSTRKASVENVSSLITIRKNSASVSDFITQEQIRRTPDKTTSDVIKRISGASIQEDRFVIIRGLNDRYNAAFINGAPLPSTESDRKAFAFDIFPAAILDNIIIYKTATPDKSGDFAGGLLDITTKSIAPKNFTSISFRGSYNTMSTGKDRYYSENKGSKDWIGLDDGTRGMPPGLPSSIDIKNVLTPEQKADLAKLFKDYKWGVRKGATHANYMIELSEGFNIENKGKDFIGVLLSANYSRNYTFTASERNAFQNYNFSAPYHAPIQTAKYIDSIYNDEVVLALLANISVKINNNNLISWKNNLSINTDNKLIKRRGAPEFNADSSVFTTQTVSWFTSDLIYSSQLGGEHTVSRFKTKLNWLAGYTKVDREIPNLARMAYIGRFPDSNSVTAIFPTPPSQVGGSGSMFSSASLETIKSLKTDISQPYTFMKNSQNFLKVGVGYQVRERNFTSRTLGLSPYNVGGVSFDYSLLSLPEDQILLSQHYGIMKNGLGGFLIQDGTLPNSDYTASSTTLHAYIMTDQRFFKKFRLIYGVRMERFNQKLDALIDLSRPVHTDTVITDYLPSVNFVYSVTPKTNLRLSYASTINRPEFRELAPFIFFEYVSNYSISGQADLVRARINNYDIRYEFFPGRAQLFSISGFYKDFKHPIEFVTLPNTTNQAVYINSTSAKLYGIEAEFRTLLSTLFGIKNEKNFLNKITWAANGAYMESSVKLEGLFGLPINQLVTDRALQGQSPYTFNTSIGYNDERIGLSSTLSINRVGDRVAIGGCYNIPDIYEKAMTIMDFQLAKFFMNNAFELKFNIKNLLGEYLNFYYDFDKSKSFTAKDRYYTYGKTPRIFGLAATLKF